MPPLTLPPTFHNSFWSQDYRTALEVLFAKLEQGCTENDEILAFVKARIKAEANLSAALTQPAPIGQSGRGFGADDGASLLVTFRGLQQESISVGEAHQEVARDLKETVAEPFEDWSYQHARRIEANRRDLIDGWVEGYENELADIESIRARYLEKSHKANEAEDDLKFAPGLQDAADKYTSGSMSPPEGIVKRTASLTEKLTDRLRTIGQRSREPSPARHPRMAEPKSTLEMFADAGKGTDDGASDDGTVTPKLDKGKGKEVEHSSPQTMSPVQQPVKDSISINIPSAPAVTVTTHLVLGGVDFAATEVSSLLFKAQSEMPLRNVKVTLFGEYDHCFSGEELVVWLKNNVPGFKGSLDLAEDAARTLTEEYKALRRIGELGNKFDNSSSVFYQFRAKAFNLQAALQRASQDDSVAVSPIGATFSDTVSSGMKRSNTVISSLVKAVQTATATDGTAEPPHMKARRAADEADVAYRKACRELDQHRCALEERIEESLKTLQRWEADRLQAVKTVLLQYQGITTSINSPLMASNDRASVLISSYMPENDLKALMERYRTGPFRPSPKLYESVNHETDASFGIDLRKWAGEGAFAPIRSIGSVDEMHTEMSRKDLPPVLPGLLDALRTAYGTLPDDDQRRKTWIYEVPLPPVHKLRATLNTLPFDMSISPDLFKGVDPPVLAGTVKLWLLELDPPVGTWEGWDEIKKLYPSVGGSTDEGAEKEKQHLEDLRGVLGRVPLIHLRVLDAVVTHLKTLLETTTTQESNDVYLTKLTMSMGRSVLRPRQETSMSIQSNHSPRFLADLIKYRDDILPQVLEKKKRESAQRAVPVRKRTKPFDARQMRRSMDISADPKKYLEAQFALKNPHSRPNSPNPAAAQQQGDRPPAFLSPPSSPPANVQKVELTDNPVPPPNPVSLNDDKSPQRPASEIAPAVAADNRTPSKETPPSAGGSAPRDEPFNPPSATPSAASPVATSPSANSPSDAVLGTGPTNLHRTTSGEPNRVRGPRVPSGARGPRPLSTAAAATVGRGGSPAAARTASPRQSSTGTTGHPRT